MKKLFLFILLTCNLTNAQDFSDSWEGLFSFTTIVDIEESATSVYAASENAVFIYDLSSRTFTTLTTINGLSGDEISQIHYSEDKSLLVIGYENGLLQIVDQDGEVIDVVAIKDKQVIPPDNKRINEFKESGDLIYIATDFGIAIYNLSRLEFDDTYFIGDNGAQIEISSIEIYQDFLYAATSSSGVRRASITDPFLIDFMNWSQINGSLFSEVTSFNSQLFGLSLSRQVFQLGTANFQPTATTINAVAIDAHTSDVFFTVATPNAIQVFDTNFVEILSLTSLGGFNYNFTQAISLGNDLFIGTEENGMIRVNIQDQTDFEFIVADGPTRNKAFSITASPDELWVAYGDHDELYNPFPLERLGVSHLVGEEGWTNFEAADVLNIASISTITINPDNSDEVYLNSMHDGLLEFADGLATTLYGINNSTLESILPPATDFVRISNSVFDNQGNLWSLANKVDNALNRRTPSGQWTSFDVSEEVASIAIDQGITRIVANNNGTIFFGTIANGLVGFDPATNQFANLIDDVGLGNLVNSYVTTLRLDLSGQLWIGSNQGLRVLFNPNSMFSENPSDARSIIIEDTNGIPRELLADEAVTDIEIDGNNNKWIATASSGAFLFSPSGRETLFQFTTDNSPLPTNSVNDIAIDESTGKIYFATDKGIVAFQGERSSKPQDDLENVRAFPNPVRPGFDGNVTIDGLTDRARVKITDIEGNLVYEAVSQGGSIPWDTRSFSGNKVASGVYFLFISTSDNIETTVSKLMIVR
ncbi:T9SS type A sorting domain-containing protein [uncultured Nonlabens sp.]|uniref:type IX secretion system anionic LPS delivery protein PorZ n=1 Tax=uncultured Nonlabens sp. TaxID=859306 RepID=UPI0030D9C47D|tara:strand:- start:41393 stop:43678 length:2286 start_codon:yes stop_codon:yes gene_type:complete